MSFDIKKVRSLHAQLGVELAKYESDLPRNLDNGSPIYSVPGIAHSRSNGHNPFSMRRIAIFGWPRWSWHNGHDRDFLAAETAGGSKNEELAWSWRGDGGYWSLNGLALTLWSIVDKIYSPSLVFNLPDYGIQWRIQAANEDLTWLYGYDADRGHIVQPFREEGLLRPWWFKAATGEKFFHNMRRWSSGFAYTAQGDNQHMTRLIDIDGRNDRPLEPESDANQWSHPASAADSEYIVAADATDAGYGDVIVWHPHGERRLTLDTVGFDHAQSWHHAVDGDQAAFSVKQRIGDRDFFTGIWSFDCQNLAIRPIYKCMIDVSDARFLQQARPGLGNGMVCWHEPDGDDVITRWTHIDG